MTNLFSIFDPVTHFKFVSLNWTALGSVLVLPSLFWLTYSKPAMVFKLGLNTLVLELKPVLSKGVSNSIYLVLLTLLLFIFTNNFLGLLPYIFTAPSHLSVTLSLGLPLWFGYVSWNFMFNTSSALAHLVPQGTPLVLVPFMVLIEIISNFMRPLTLSVRLAANMVAGHLLLVLVSTPMPSLPLVYMVGAFSALVALMVLELGVSFIQSYVFMTLSSLYIDEIYNINN